LIVIPRLLIVTAEWVEGNTSGVEFYSEHLFRVFVENFLQKVF
jgi:hypothetical protein